MGKNRARRGKSHPKASAPVRNASTRWQRIPKALKVALGILVSLATILSVYFGYVNSGADSLRSELYEPLYAEVVKVEQGLEARTLSYELPDKEFHRLQESGRLERLPRSSREKLQKLYEESGELRVRIVSLTGAIRQDVSRNIRGLRTEADDQKWFDDAMRRTKAAEVSQDSSILSFTFRHAGRGPVVDSQDPKGPRVVFYGGPTWQINDWIEYPESVQKVEQNWNELQFLYFDDTEDVWYRRITRHDLLMHRLTLSEFLKRIHEKLLSDPDFDRLKRIDATRALAKNLKTTLADRIQQPKRLADLFDWAR